MKKNIKKTARYIALNTLDRVQKGGAYSNLMLRESINKNKLNDKDSRLLTEIVYGTLSRQRLLNFYLQPFIVKAKKVDDWVKILLQLSLYQMLYLDKVPTHAILNEAVEIAKARGNEGIGKFVNGVLRNLDRQGVPSLDTIEDPTERLSREISMPKWLTQKLINEIGEEETRRLGLSLFEASHVSCRVDTRKISRQEVLAILEEEGIEASESLVSPYGIIADKGFIAGSRLFQYGLLTIQDESSMLVAPALQIEPEHQVLDACAAPGGKTTHIATFLDSEAGGKVTALDIHEHKIELIKDNAKRLQVTDVVEPKKLDARMVGETFPAETFDRILVDAPCSGLGLMRRKPDIKYNKRPEDFKKLPIIQLEILESVAPTLKSSGILVYSTCTFAPEENQAVIEQFLSKHPDFSLVEVPVSDVVQSSIKNQMLTIYPQQYMTDGFFISCLRKK
ncbi:16S rRNA (cytosine(967)-C(5))-methyltransferase RsmB [Enterococcus saccharolyticus]|uniref:16S rRNA (cytosine(967)-C(5))-methyltransferase n=1 Tax=Candidatus Enterococcus willemsii TaxID=1857215 RepID=A0ABQ6YZR7_9ENTE|nr:MULTISPECIES: 16S rRNA (cytosine(967)-C(5))-methyltransferase RsmB [Enterococcus]KAF1304116.1 16S rRNA (cytosine(967)-C(5))-methyltransferase [Enterococcus sp. CU12B]MCD5002011.1 16S rRNA (cytosine(967)-C(5))-methyltransferase RsmB [Enterococcus saccharolyticus]